MVIEMKRCMVNIGVHGHHGSISSTVEDPCCTNRTGKRPSKGQLIVTLTPLHSFTS